MGTLEKSFRDTLTLAPTVFRHRSYLMNSMSCFWLYYALSAVLSLPTSVTALPHQSSITAKGHWEGTITREGKTWRVNLEIESRSSGSAALVDLVDYAIYDIPFSVTANANQLRVERKQPTGANVSFIGTVEGDTFSGEFTGVGVTARFELKRTKKKPEVLKEEEVIFRNGEVTLAGTLIAPNGPSPHPAVVVTHGGGPDGRQKAGYNSDGYFFARHGVAALIYDKRGVGESTGDYEIASLEDLADDALAGVHLLKARKDIDGRRIGVTGTSQGGWISPLAATRSSDVAFIVVISASGINPMDQSIFNIDNVLKNARYSQDVVSRASELRKRLYARARSGSFDPTFLADIEKAHTEPWFKLSELPYPVSPSLAEGARRFLLFEPIPIWEQVKVRSKRRAWGYAVV